MLSKVLFRSHGSISIVIEDKLEVHTALFPGLEVGLLRTESTDREGPCDVDVSG